MASFWDETQKKVIRSNSRNQGPTIWGQDAANSQPIDDIGHDTHDQGLADSISDTLHLRGFNQMLANLNVGGFKIVGMGDGSAATDGASMNQLNASNTRITALETWKAGPTKITGIKSAGTIRHKADFLLTGSARIADTTQYSRFVLDCNSAISLTINRPAGVDADLGEQYCVEGSVLVTNGATPGAITLVGVNANNILGAQDLTPSAVYVLTYLIHRSAGNVYREVYSWAT